MNIFILNSGRCGSSTFIEACRSIENFSAGHESRIHSVGAERIDYPPNHIEADNRLSWLLGRIDQRFGQDAHYVHLRRSPEAVIKSFSQRAEFGIMQAYREGILLGVDKTIDNHSIASDYLETVETNITLFLRDKPLQMNFDLENAAADFTRFWHWIGAEGELQSALSCWSIRYNASLTEQVRQADIDE